MLSASGLLLIVLGEFLGWLLTAISNWRWERETKRRDARLWARVPHRFQGYLVSGSLTKTIKLNTKKGDGEDEERKADRGHEA
jgi:hypothetical protein